MDGPKSYGEYRIVHEDEMRRLERAEKDNVQLVLNGNAQLRAVRAQLAEVKKALEWYAERANWRERFVKGFVAAIDDKGRRARKALGLE